MSVTAITFASRPAPTMTVLPPLPEPSSADEINHRIANSLQMLAAMVSLEARTITDPAARAALDLTRQRIGAIAGVHRQLYQAGQADLVRLDHYLAELGDDLERSCADAAAGRRVIVTADAVRVASDDAASLGIVVSELVTNACKYAYPDAMPGAVRIDLHALPVRGYRLVVEDRGRGRTGATSGTGMGARLIDMIVARLGGTAVWQDARPGTRFDLRVGTA
jgi:two-component sensor histidine kinase